MASHFLYGFEGLNCEMEEMEITHWNTGNITP